MQISISATAEAAAGAGLRLDFSRNDSNGGVVCELEAGAAAHPFSLDMSQHNDRLTLARPAVNDTGARVTGTVTVDNAGGERPVFVLLVPECHANAAQLLVQVPPGATGQADFTLERWCDELRVSIGG